MSSPYDVVRCPICAVPRDGHDPKCVGERHRPGSDPSSRLSEADRAVIRVNSPGPFEGPAAGVVPGELPFRDAVMHDVHAH